MERKCAFFVICSYLPLKPSVSSYLQTTREYREQMDLRMNATRVKIKDGVEKEVQPLGLEKIYADDNRTGSNEGLHVCHIISQANGGANHPDNYFLFSGEANGKFSNKLDHVNVYLVGKEKAEKAVKISRQLGNINVDKVPGDVDYKRLPEEYDMITLWNNGETDIEKLLPRITYKIEPTKNIWERRCR
jgi:hypothetical protein